MERERRSLCGEEVVECFAEFGVGDGAVDLGLSGSREEGKCSHARACVLLIFARKVNQALEVFAVAGRPGVVIDHEVGRLGKESLVEAEFGDAEIEGSDESIENAKAVREGVVLFGKEFFESVADGMTEVEGFA